MKKFKSINQILSVSIMLFIMLATFKVRSQEVNDKKTGIHIHIEIGRIKKGCNGFWFCKGSTIDIDINSSKSNALIIVDKQNKTATLYLKDLQGKKFDGRFDGTGENNVTFKGVGTIIAKKYMLTKLETGIYKKKGYNYVTILDLK